MEVQLKQIRQDVKDNAKNITEIKDNHLAHLKEDVNDLRVTVEGVKTDVSWLKQNHWKVVMTIVMSIVVSLIGAVISLLN